LAFLGPKPCSYTRGVGPQILRCPFIGGISHQLFEPAMPRLMDESRGIGVTHQPNGRLSVA
jgi:hypothetical protein